MPTYFHCIAGSARSYTFTISTVLVAQSPGAYLGGAVFKRAKLLRTVCGAEPSGASFVGAVIHGTFLSKE